MTQKNDNEKRADLDVVRLDRTPENTHYKKIVMEESNEEIIVSVYNSPVGTFELFLQMIILFQSLIFETQQCKIVMDICRMSFIGRSFLGTVNPVEFFEGQNPEILLWRQ